MKKLLLILLCLPMIGFGQDNKNKLTFEEALSKSKKKVIFEVVEQSIKIVSKLNDVADLSLTTSNGEIKVVDTSRGLYAISEVKYGEIILFIKKENQLITSYTTIVRRIPAPELPEDLKRIKRMVSGLITLHID